MSKERRRKTVMLADVYNPEKHNDVSGWYASEKLDGQRAWWDGGVTRGQVVMSIPWANRLKKSDDYLASLSTGLWTRYNNVINAPTEWLDSLPKGITLDGELYLGVDSWGALRSIISRDVPDPVAWSGVQYLVFDRPAWYNILSPGTVKDPNTSVVYSGDLIPGSVIPSSVFALDRSYDMQTMLKTAHALVDPEAPGPFAWHKQVQLNGDPSVARDQVEAMLDKVVSRGGEGLILRHPAAVWIPYRVNSLLKVKPYSEGRATVIGFTPGLGKLEGMMGNLICRWVNPNGREVTFELSGFTDAERRLTAVESLDQGLGQESFVCQSFPVGSSVPFKYRSLSPKEGRPIEGRYNREEDE